MATQILVENKKYEGKYVALKSFTDNTVIASGTKPEDVVKEANKNGSVDPVVVFVRKHDVACIY